MCEHALQPVRIRPFRPGDEPALFQVFLSSVHGLTAADYSREQCDAWAPWDMPQAQWSAAMREMRPFVAEFEGMVAGYADLQPDGRIGHFFVAAGHARRGIGTALLRHLMESARRQSIDTLFADVSLTAEPFFAKAGFALVGRQFPVRRGVRLANARMVADRRGLP